MKKKIILLSLVFVLLAIPAAYLQLRDGVMLDGRFFVQKSDQLYVNGKDSVSISPDDKGAEIRIVLGQEQLDARMTVSDQKYTFAFGDGRTVEGYAGRWSDELVDAEGMPLWLEKGVTIVVGNEPEPSILTDEYSLSNVLYHMTEGICEQRGHLLVIAMAMVIYALGVASIFRPEEVHFFGVRWRYAHAELSDDGILVQKIRGAAFAVAGVVLLYAPLFW